jgi:hypothetical protein
VQRAGTQPSIDINPNIDPHAPLRAALLCIGTVRKPALLFILFA